VAGAGKRGTATSYAGDVNAQDSGGDTPLHWATWRDGRRLVEGLLAQGADPPLCNAAGMTPLDVATAGGHEDVAGLLRARGDRQETQEGHGR
jgi:ankyrin repeat protein